jgi:small ubiquitin-related modifier
MVEVRAIALATPPPSKLANDRASTPKMADSGTPGQGDGVPAPVEHLNIKVTDNNNEVFFKIKRTTPLKKLMDAFCERQGKQPSTVRFLFDGTRVRPEDSPETVRNSRDLMCFLWIARKFLALLYNFVLVFEG